jgi:hypothetical protein
VPMPHLISTPRCHCQNYCFSSFFQLLRRRSYVRIVLGRPNFISDHIKVGWRIVVY